MRRWFYYSWLAVTDLWSLREAVWIQVIVVAGICLPVLLLLGLKRGHVADLRKELLASPSGREVEFWSGQKGALLRRSTVDQLGRELSHVETVIPYCQHLAALSRTGADGRVREVAAATFASTTPEDPVLKLHGVPRLGKAERAVVLGQSLASELGLEAGDRVTLTVQRRGGERASVELSVTAVLATDTEADQVGYLDVDFHDWIEQYLRGYPVRELNWPASGEPAPDGYIGYALFCERTSDLTDADRETLDRFGMIVEKASDEMMGDLAVLFRTEELQVYFVHTLDSPTNPRERVRKPPSDITRLTAADDVALPWNRPRVHTVGGVQFRLLGCTLPTRTWLRSYLRDPSLAFDYDTEEMAVKVLDATTLETRDGRSVLQAEAEHMPSSVPLRLIPAGRWLRDEVAMACASFAVAIPMSWHAGTTAVLLAGTSSAAVHAALPRPAQGALSAVVPVHLLAHLDALDHGTVQFDPLRGVFAPVSDEVSYARARLYATDIDAVPSVVQQLGERNFIYESKSARIKEIHRQDDSLTFIVVLVSLGVLAFGVFTVYNVLHDSTARKRSMIGIVRVMGVSQPGVFYFVFLRASVIGVMAGVMTLSLGYLLQWPLGVMDRFRMPDNRIALLVTGLGASMVALLGVSPSVRRWRARRSRVGHGAAIVVKFLLLTSVALLAACVLARLLDFRPILLILRSGDSLGVFGCAVFCCILGSLVPAWDASRVDPFEAVIEGKFR